MSYTMIVQLTEQSKAFTSLLIAARFQSNGKMHPLRTLVTFGILAFSGTTFVASGARYDATLDPEGNYYVSWEVPEGSNEITFEVSCKTTGYVGFGISPTSSMWEADIVIGGVLTNGTVFFADRHGIGQRTPPLDDSQDWVLISANKNDTHTNLVFSRLLDTGDYPNDVAIEDKNSSFIYAWGTLDDLVYYHGPNRGNYDLNILNPVL